MLARRYRLSEKFPALATDGSGRYFWSGGEVETLGDAAFYEAKVRRDTSSEIEIESLYRSIFKEAREMYERQFFAK